MNNVDYKVLKSCIIRSCTPVRDGSIEFRVNYDKLLHSVDDINLLPLNVGMCPKKVIPEMIPYLSEYFEKTNLSWFTENKYSTVITFIDTESIDEEAQRLIDKLHMKQVDDPSNDKVNDMATLVANYPCYFATIVSYRNDDPKRSGKPSYEIKCRANKVVIKSSDYQYNPKDFS
jgi:hypothetical protein